MSIQRIGIALLTILLVSIFRIAPAKAQVQGGGWSKPYRLSSEAGSAGEASCVADQYGYVHCFWSETLFDGQHTIIQYARFDGGTWSAPNDIYLTYSGIANISAVVDQDGTLHIVWVEGLYGPAYYTYAPASSALSAQNWAPPRRIDIPAGMVQFRVDSKGTFHILYINRSEELGVYYVRSKDKGETWSEPVWLDPDILPGHTPDSLSFELDENDGLHAVWVYGALELGARPDWVRYIHSLDGGDTWSSPLLIDQYDAESEHNLTNAGPRMIVQGQTVHVIWAAGSLPHRHHRFSTDGGLTWSAPVQILGELHGQAGDSVTVDGAGRVHFLGQIRYPIAIYEATWDQNRWSKPSLVYPIAGEDEDMGDRIHAHLLHAVVRAGNQLVLTFGDPPAEAGRRLFATYRTLDDILPLESMPIPIPTAALVPMSSPTAGPPTSMPEPTATAPSFVLAEVQDSERAAPPDLAIRVALVPTLLLLGGTLIFRLRQKNKP